MSQQRSQNSTNNHLDNRLDIKNNGTFHDSTQGKPDSISHNNNKEKNFFSRVIDRVSATVGMGYNNNNNSQQELGKLDEIGDENGNTSGENDDENGYETCTSNNGNNNNKENSDEEEEQQN